jgi:hypothetical protein
MRHSSAKREARLAAQPQTPRRLGEAEREGFDEVEPT